MGVTTGISWTTRTWNGVIGCSKISEGCARCYAERLATTKFRHFLGGPVWGPGNPRHITGKQLWKAPLKWAREARQTGERIMVFGNSLYDLCEDHPTVNVIRPRIWELVDETRDAITWQFLTKRPERLADCLPQSWKPFWEGVWLGTSIENDAYFHRADHLRAVEAAVRFISVEPALGPVAHALNLEAINWCIWGGEAGPGFRPADPKWARDLLAACRKNHVAFFYKQSAGPVNGKGTLDGVEIKEFPVPRPLP